MIAGNPKTLDQVTALLCAAPDLVAQYTTHTHAPAPTHKSASTVSAPARGKAATRVEMSAEGAKSLNLEILRFRRRVLALIDKSLIVRGHTGNVFALDVGHAAPVPTCIHESVYARVYVCMCGKGS